MEGAGDACVHVTVDKARRTLEIWDGERLLHSARAALGASPVGAKRAQGDGKTPEGVYHICLVKEKGKYGRSLGLDYPGEEDARLAFTEGRIDRDALDAILLAHEQRRRPPWGTALGGEIYLHEGGAASDWTAGCVALEPADMDALFAVRDLVREVRIRP